MSKNGMHSDLEPTPDGAATVVPTFAPAQHERALNTRSASAAHDRRARTMQVACPASDLQSCHAVLSAPVLRMFLLCGSSEHVIVE